MMETKVSSGEAHAYSAVNLRCGSEEVVDTDTADSNLPFELDDISDKMFTRQLSHGNARKGG